MQFYLMSLSREIDIKLSPSYAKTFMKIYENSGHVVQTEPSDSMEIMVT